MRITLIIAVFSVLGAAYYINSHLPRLPQIAGLHEQKPTENVVYIKFHRDSTLSAADKVLTEAITSHEMVHDFRARGIFDIDVPIAAVTGYYIEWLRTDKLREPDKQREFSAGMSNGFSTNELRRLFEPYMRYDAVEDSDSYRVAARVAGMIAARFGKNSDEVHQFLLALGIGLSPEFALEAIKDRDLFGLLVGYRMGQFFRVDYDEINRRLNALTPAAAQNAKRYLDIQNENAQLALIKTKRGRVTSLDKGR